MKSLLEAAKSDDDDEKIGENDEAKKEFEDIVVDVSSTKVITTWRLGKCLRLMSRFFLFVIKFSEMEHYI